MDLEVLSGILTLTLWLSFKALLFSQGNRKGESSNGETSAM